MNTITLCAVSSANVVLTQRALDISRSKMAFADTVFVTAGNARTGDYRIEPCPFFNNGAEAANWAWSNISHLFTTSHVLFVQWDGYVINPTAWSDDFFHYDYIGATWPWYPVNKVGNGGFCLRSTRLIKALEKYPAPDDKPEDAYICRGLRRSLEQEGFRFAPEEVADRFSFERSEPRNTFGFHGPHNFPHVMSDEDLISILPAMDDYVVAGQAYGELMMIYARMGKGNVLHSMVANGQGRQSEQRQSV